MTRLDQQERAIWIRLANDWEDARAGETTAPVVLGTARGLCPALDVLLFGLEYDDKLDAETRGRLYERMFSRVERRRKRLGRRRGSYLWPPTFDGAKLRAAFCRRQAAALERA